MKWWCIAGLIALVASCSQPESQKPDDSCPGGGDELTVDGENLCVYDTRQSNIIETGFECPVDRATRTDFGDLIVCSDGIPPMGVEDDLEEAYPGADLGQDDCVNVLCEAGETCVDGECVTEDPNNNNSCVPVAEVCGDDFDNDCDGDVDCDDDDCAADDYCDTTLCPDSSEPNDTPAQATDELVMLTAAGLCGASDVDHWRIGGEGGDRIAVTVTPFEAAALTIDVIDALGEPVYDDDSQALSWTDADLPVGFRSVRRGTVTPMYIRISGDEVGYDVSVERVTPIQLGDVEQIGAGEGFTCARQSGGAILCWGRNDKLQLGDRQIGSSSYPLPLTTSMSAQRLWVGPEHACALMEDAHPYCWGDNTAGELGSVNLNPIGVPATNGLMDVQEMALGRNHTCALLQSGQVQCWGDNSKGQLGDSTFFDPWDATAHTVSTIDDATAIAAGENHTCVLRADSSVWCWGDSSVDQLCDPMLGFDDWTRDPMPISCAVDGPVSGTTLTAAGNWTIAHQAGYGLGWGAIPGFDPMGGVGAALDIPFTSGFDPAPTATRTWAGANSWCRMEAQGLACMGDGPWMQNPVLAGGDEFASTSNGVYGFYTKDLPAPRSVGLGYDHHCAVQQDGRAICWGYNDDGQLGNGTTSNAAMPVYVELPGE